MTMPWMPAVATGSDPNQVLLAQQQDRMRALQNRLQEAMQQSQDNNLSLQGLWQKRQQKETLDAARAHLGHGGRMGGGMGAGGNYEPYSGSAPTGNLGQWISQALQKTGLGNEYAGGIANMIKHESGGNPNAVNRWDSNWKAGHPSIGLMQTIQPTFNRWKLPGYDNIYNPVANIIAGIRYAQNRYGNDMLRAGGRRSGGRYIGY